AAGDVNGHDFFSGGTSRRGCPKNCRTALLKLPKSSETSEVWSAALSPGGLVAWGVGTGARGGGTVANPSQPAPPCHGPARWLTRPAEGRGRSEELCPGWKQAAHPRTHQRRSSLVRSPQGDLVSAGAGGGQGRTALGGACVRAGAQCNPSGGPGARAGGPRPVPRRP